MGSGLEGRPGRPALVGMVHLRPLPGSAGWQGDLGAVVDAAAADAEALVRGGCDALLVENMGDAPYLRGAVAPETLAAMVAAALPLRRFGLPLGVQVLAGAWAESLGLAVAVGAAFLRVEAFVYGHLADEGWMDACAGPLLRRRAALGARVAVWADIQKKHAAHAASADLGLAGWARGAAFCGADAVVVTGAETGAPTAAADAAAARAGGLPVAAGSGVTAENAGEIAPFVDAVIVGTALKRGGDWRGPVEVARVEAVRRALRAGA